MALNTRLFDLDSNTHSLTLLQSLHICPLSKKHDQFKDREILIKIHLWASYMFIKRKINILCRYKRKLKTIIKRKKKLHISFPRFSKNYSVYKIKIPKRKTTYFLFFFEILTYTYSNVVF